MYEIDVQPNSKGRYRWFIKVDGKRVAQGIAPSGFETHNEALTACTDIIKALNIETVVPLKVWAWITVALLIGAIAVALVIR